MRVCGSGCTDNYGGAVQCDEAVRPAPTLAPRLWAMALCRHGRGALGREKSPYRVRVLVGCTWKDVGANLIITVAGSACATSGSVDNDVCG